MRTFGKEYYRYLKDAEKLGIKFIVCRVPAVEKGDNGRVTLKWTDEQNIKSDDLDFLKRLDLAGKEVWIDKEKNLTFSGRMKRPEIFLLIRQLGEDFVKTLSHNELMNICRKKGINITGTALKEFLLYHSIKKEKPWRPLKKREEKLADEGLKLLESKKRDFKFYLWGANGPERFFKHMESLKDKTPF